MNWIKKLIPQNLKNIYHLFQAIIANVVFGFPSRKMKVIGVTGTNGKTTVCQMVAKILEENNLKVAMVSTINFKIGGKKWVNKTKFTTLSSWSIQKFIAGAVKADCEYLVLETSSHSLDQYRVWGVQYRTAVITNITREHLDYHQTMEEYRAVKLELFKKAKIAVVNLDMEKPEDFLELEYEKLLTYSIKNDKADILAKDIKLNKDSSQFTVNSSQFFINLLGEFNIENALAAISIGISENIPIEKIKSALERIKGIPGRLEFIPNDKNLNIVIDYAVTPDSLEKLYALIKKLKCHPEFISGSNNEMPKQVWHDKSKIIAVFGACGERDRGKRPMMGEIVSQSADYIILTDEDPYNEDPVQIIEEVAAGIKNKKLGENLWKILDRREAIKKALQIAKHGDYIIITGKGAEETMAIGSQRIPWNDKKVIQELLQK
ncbi:MAG: UDP-N-acetylmuramoyl-L-alanyl-D-glutamate--2,6-diaminopimelate ligase [Candidatus Moranbacteria bacterium]|nr:UDP-N-acetylmuramoyl-L-alanyl-D-glutamate--2,6-diaminopimelate ligase [Candidatus Moranbacteria bacterium]